MIELKRDNYRNLDWLQQYLAGHEGFICGGCFKNILNNEKEKEIEELLKIEPSEETEKGKQVLEEMFSDKENKIWVN